MERLAAGSSGRGRVARIALAFMVAIVAFSGAFAHTTVSRAQSTPPSQEAMMACSPMGFHNVRIGWGEVERALAAPDASAEVADALAEEMRQVYRPDGTMDMHALEALLTPELREAAGVDCSGMDAPPPMAGTTVSEDRQAYVDQVRQIDAKTVSAFIVLPGMMVQPAPGATPAAVGVVDGTPLPGTEIVDAVLFAIFVQEDGEWKISHLSMGMVVFSDVAPKGQAPSDSFIGSWAYPAADLRATGMPDMPEGSEVVASPVATPAS